MRLWMLCLVVTLASPAIPNVTAAYEGGTVKSGGTIVGEVRLAGKVPSPKKIVIDKDQEVCGTERLSEVLLVAKDGAVKNAVASLVDIAKGKPLERPKGPIEFVQKGCWFLPHVLLLPVDATVVIINGDPLTHNVHTFSIDNAPINRAQPKTVKRMTATVEFPETIKVQCDIHTRWMGAWWIVREHPYYAITKADGQFRLTDVPAGTYQLKVWQEALGEQIQSVTVKSGETVKVVFEYQMKK